jgi:predicted RNase H-like nuclease
MLFRSLATTAHVPECIFQLIKAQARKNHQDKCESLNRAKKVLPSLAPFKLGIFSNVAGSPHGDVVFDWVVNSLTAIAQGLVDGKIPASQQIYNAICERPEQ